MFHARKYITTAAVLIILLSVAVIASSEQDSFSSYVDKDGTVKRPVGYRTTWVHLGSWIVPDENAPGAGFHDVYSEPESVEHYRQTGSFPDGATLIKEIRKVRTSDMTTGKASWAGEPVIWFVMIKDSKNRFSGSPNWGNGWGWALFKSDAPQKNVSTNFEKDCIGCHMPAKKTDWIYIEGYPTLK